MSNNFATKIVVLLCLISLVLTSSVKTLLLLAQRTLRWRWLGTRKRQIKDKQLNTKAEIDRSTSIHSVERTVIDLPVVERPEVKATRSKLRFAVIIDSENVSMATIPEVFLQISKMGTAPIRRAYGDWSNTGLRGWKHVLSQYSILPIHQFRPEAKSIADSIIIVDALDLLHTQHQLDGFCIVSSDQDFIPLISRIRRQGLIVYAFGTQRPKEVVEACDEYIQLQIPQRVSKPAIKKQKPVDFRKDEKLIACLKTAYEAARNPQGWVELGQFRSKLAELSPEFHQKRYGFAKFSAFVRATGLFDTKLQNRQIWICEPGKDDSGIGPIEAGLRLLGLDTLD